jgi:hypothetical protein
VGGKHFGFDEGKSACLQGIETPSKIASGNAHKSGESSTIRLQTLNFANLSQPLHGVDIRWSDKPNLQSVRAQFDKRGGILVVADAYNWP